MTLTEITEQIDENADDKGRPTWADFKRVVWHKSFSKLLESIESHSKVRCWVKCGDGLVRHIFPLILLLAADYEEQ